ncbi:MAG: glycosyltransferase family 4 protein [Candidatus Aminicenantaceae bacterium]
MKVVLVNKFLFPKGGDAIYVNLIGKLLSEKGHDIAYWGMLYPENSDFKYSQYFIPFIDYNNLTGFKNKLRAAGNILYSKEAKGNFEKVIHKFKPDIVHVNNFAHQISPSILPTAKKYDLPVVMTIHDYKLVCPAYTMMSKGFPCEECKNGNYHMCFLKKCVKDSYVKSLINWIEMTLHHKIMKIYKHVDVYISPSNFLKSKIIEMGFKGEIIHIPNFVYQDTFEPYLNSRANRLCYFGRLSNEKGLFTLLRAKKNISFPLVIIGEGPEKDRLEKFARNNKIKNIKFLGYKSGTQLINEISRSLAVVISSEWYENNPYSVIEAFACGKAVVGSRIGGIPELVKDGITGLTFQPGNASDLENKLKYVIEYPDEIDKMGENAKIYTKEDLNPEKYYIKLMDVYTKALGKNKFRKSKT